MMALLEGFFVFFGAEHDPAGVSRTGVIWLTAVVPANGMLDAGNGFLH